MLCCVMFVVRRPSYWLLFLFLVLCCVCCVVSCLHLCCVSGAFSFASYSSCVPVFAFVFLLLLFLFVCCLVAWWSRGLDLVFFAFCVASGLCVLTCGLPSIFFFASLCVSVFWPRLFLVLLFAMYSSF